MYLVSFLIVFDTLYALEVYIEFKKSEQMTKALTL